MRAGLNWATQQTLTAEAALVLRHSLGLARRRRHAQLTPLHIAVALLSSSRPSLLTKACLQSRNRNLPPPASIAYSMQCRAIELCFNVALNRLPTITSESPVSNQSVPLSNALIAALKRAQANQRRGCIEGHQNQQENQTFVNIKVELGQLIISILDDPSVSRALREAGFSSIAVKDHIEEYYSNSIAATSVPSKGNGLSPHSFRFHELGIPLPLMRNHEAVIEIPKPFSMLDCCEECNSNYEREVHLLKSFPFGLQSIPEDEDLVELRKKWAKLCHSGHRDKLNRRSSKYIASPGTKNVHLQFGLWTDNHSPISFGDQARDPNLDDIRKNLRAEPNLDVLKRSEGKEVDVTLSLGNSNVCLTNKISGREHLIMKLKENVPWQREKFGSIANALLEVLNKSGRRDVWFMLEGNDIVGKRRLGYAIGESLLGSADSVIYFNTRVRSYGLQDIYNELFRRRSTCGEEKLAVIMVENIDSAESHFVKFLEERFEAGKGGSSSVGMEKYDWQVVFILTKGDSCYKGRTSSVVHMLLKANEYIQRKRKPDWEFSSMIKKQRLGDNGSFMHTEAYSPVQQRTTNSIDLNVEVDAAEIEAEESSPNASNITQETDQIPQTFIETIENRIIFDQSPASDIEKKEILFSKFKRSFDEVYGIEDRVGFSVDDPVLEELIQSSGFVSDSLMEKWMRDIFQTSLNIVRISGRSGEVVRLCIGDGEKMNLGDGFLNSSLPNKIKITFD